MCNCYVKWKITAVALLLYLADSVYGQNYSYVTTKYGVVRGQLYEITFPGNPKPEKVKSYDRFEYEQYVATYFGIPYAKPPVGELRFKKPQPPDSWKDTLNADTMPPACVQYSEYPFPWYDSDPGQSEDCLYLNVYAPYQNPPIRPVKLYIHGGGFSAGSNRIQLYDGFNDSVSFYNVPPDKNYDTDPNLGFYGFVDVVINYRLGAMGFLTSGTEDAPGNVGLYDMLSAVQWVRDNIAEFGGDPDDITLYGQGAGAIAVSLLSVSPLAHGLFKRAAMVGGSFFSIPKTQFYDNLRLSERLAEAVGCNGTNLLADPEGTVRCLRGVEATELAKVLSSFDPTSHYSFYPQFEQDDLIPIPPVYLMDLGNVANLQGMLTGFTADEGSYLLTTARPDVFGVFGENDVPMNASFAQTVLTDYLREKGYPDPEDIAVRLLQNGGKDIRRTVFRAMGDERVVCPMLYFAEKAADLGTAVYMLEFVNKHPTYNPWAEWMGSVHFNAAQYEFMTAEGKLVHIQGETHNTTYLDYHDNFFIYFVESMFFFTGKIQTHIASAPFTRQNGNYVNLNPRDFKTVYIDDQAKGEKERYESYEYHHPSPYNCDVFRPYHLDSGDTA